MEENEKPYGKLQWIFYIVLVPTVFTLVLVGIIFTFLGYNVLDATKNFFQSIPIVSTLWSSDEKKEDTDESEATESLDEQLVQKEAELHESEEEIAQLKSLLQQRENEINQLKEDVERLELEKEQTKLSDEERTTQIRELAQLYGGMSAKRSASILQNMTLTEAALIIREMESDQRSGIMSRFDPAFAAKLTVALKELDQVQNPDVAALQERVNLLMAALDVSDEDIEDSMSGSMLPFNNLVNTVAQMPATQAGELFEQMSKSDSELAFAAKVLALMTDEVRSSIFAVMKAETVVKYLNKLAA